MNAASGLTSAALVLAACNVSVAVASPTKSAEAFLRRLYAPYVVGNAAAVPTATAAPMIFDARLTTLIRKDQAQPQGEIGALDQDPICDCQDYDKLKITGIRVIRRDSNKATAVVRFTNLATTSVLRYTLTETKRGWRVADIATQNMPSLVAFLQAGSRQK